MISGTRRGRGAWGTRDSPPLELLISLKTSSNRLHENRELVSGGRDNSGGRAVSPRQVGYPVGVLPYISYIGMCRPKGYSF